MAAELGLLSLTQLQKLAAQSQQNQNHQNLSNPNLITPGSTWMWNPNYKAQPAAQEAVDDDSWEVKAFAEDTGNVMGTTWPPRSYTCTFCRREFRSAQALGGHMNVHRRDRARLHHQTHPSASSSTTNSSSTLLIPTQEFATNGGLCLLYQFPNNPSSSTGVFTTSPPINNTCSIDSPSTFLSISQYHPSNNLMSVATPSIDFPVTPPSTRSAMDNNLNDGNNISSNHKETSIEELDLELRLGHRPTTS